jgi:ribosomal protein S27E
MAAIVKSWMRTFCTGCDRRQVFVLQPGWVLKCQECGEERHLAGNGLLAQSPAA